MKSFLDLLNPSKWPAYRKSLVALAGLVLQAAPLLALTGPAQHWTQVALAAATWITVHLTPNAKATP